MKPLAECIGISKGITVFVGGGGKTSSIFQAAKELKSQGKGVIVTTTTKMYKPTLEQVDTVLINPSQQEMWEAMEQFGVIAIGGGLHNGKMTCVSEEQLDKMSEVAPYILVEGDGSRHLPLKVPACHEPVIPKQAHQVVIVVGMTAWHQPIEISCFRKEKVGALLGKSAQDLVSFMDIIKIISHEKGLQKGIEDRSQVLVVNQMDVMVKREEQEIFKQKLKEVYRYPIVFAAVKHQRWESIVQMKG